ncbi:MAG: PD-(D/E)XK nuclease family protein, partial [Spirochaetaceae bacterium]|nr:PD-(D/E)XK nuclease family protein [Spirochaetaceae bacterium]
VPPEDKELYRLARKRYQALAEAARIMPVAELLTKLWYDEGYRYETLWQESSQIYGGLFDLFFEIARNTDRRGKGLAEFLDYINGVMTREEKLDDVSVPPLEESAGVRIMSIHKSKGLEFPVVFVYCCGSGRRPTGNRETAYFDERWGLTLNLPQAEELPGPCANYFFTLSREEENRKETAELRRLLYVAMTRAESRLFLTASLPAPGKDEKEGKNAEATEEYTVQSVKERLARLNAKKSDPAAASSFLDLLLPVLAEEHEDEPFTIELIPVKTRAEIRRAAGRSRDKAASLREAALAAAPYYDRAETTSVPPPMPASIAAGALEYAGRNIRIGGGPLAAPEAAPAEEDPLEKTLNRAGLEASDFGTIVHSFLEDRFASAAPRLPSQIPPRLQARLDDRDIPPIREAADRMVRCFLESDVGKLALNAAYRETEFPILTLAETKAGKIPVTGRIDLLFESEGVMYVVDFKTDRIEEPERHRLQLAVYSRAVSDIFGKPVRAVIFYLRGGGAVDVTDLVRDLDLVID